MNNSSQTRTSSSPVGSASVILNVKYFGVLRDRSGCDEERIRSEARTPAQLYGNLRERHSIAIEPGELQVAVNDRLSSWDTELKPDDTVAFLPPVAGG